MNTLLCLSNIETIYSVNNSYVFLINNYNNFVKFINLNGLPTAINFNNDEKFIKKVIDYLLLYCINNNLNIPIYSINNNLIHLTYPLKKYKKYYEATKR
jgi:hypothetical protein